MSDIHKEITSLIRARYPLIYVISWEERRAEETLFEISGEEHLKKRLFVWTITRGLIDYETGREVQTGTEDPLLLLDYVMACDEDGVFLLKDFHAFLDPGYQGREVVVRKLRDTLSAILQRFKAIILLSPVLSLPTELEKDTTVVDFPLPTYGEIDGILARYEEDYAGHIVVDLDAQGREQLIKAALGLTATEAENVISRAITEDLHLDASDIRTILEEKRRIVRKSGILEFIPAEEGINVIGGLDNLKKWLISKRDAFSDDARAYGLPVPKGLLLIGVQGCGKSLTAQVIANLWEMPLLRFDVGKVFSGLVGSSEENMRRAIATAESIAPAVLWIDELEKGFAGVKSSGTTDGGTTSRVFGSFVTWLQEKRSPVFVVATANDISQLPPELMRKGRFDEIFFLDLPGEEERREIFRIHIGKRRSPVQEVLRAPDSFDLDTLARETAGFSGAEIEQAFIAALQYAYADGRREPATEDVVRNVAETFPLSSTMKEQIEGLRLWARDKARMASRAKGFVQIVPEREYRRRLEL